MRKILDFSEPMVRRNVNELGETIIKTRFGIQFSGNMISFCKNRSFRLSISAVIIWTPRILSHKSDTVETVGGGTVCKQIDEICLLQDGGWHS